MTLTRRGLTLALAATPSLAWAKGPGPRVQLWATASGALAEDGRDDAGNPFATALIEAMGNPGFDLNTACAAVRRRTAELSDGRMAAQTLGIEAAPSWRFVRAGRRERRVALVAAISDYGRSDVLHSLPGAATDGERIRNACVQAGFDTRLALNATRESLPALLRNFARRSAGADVAMIYATGHGGEAAGAQYLLFGDHIMAHGADDLPLAFRWETVAEAARGRKLNITCWAGCRNQLFT